MKDDTMKDDKEKDVIKLEKSTPVIRPLPPEHGGQKGPEPTRYGDWENKGKCVDF